MWWAIHGLQKAVTDKQLEDIKNGSKMFKIPAIPSDAELKARWKDMTDSIALLNRIQKRLEKCSLFLSNHRMDSIEEFMTLYQAGLLYEED